MKIATFSAVDVPEAPAGATIAPADRSGSAFASNDQPEDGRVILIVLDEHHVSFGGRMVVVKSIARRLVERLGPSDQAAVITTSGRSVGQTEFTTDKARLIEAIDKFFPQSEHAATGIAERPSAAGAGRGGFGFISEIKTRWAMEALSNAARTLAEIPHRRKAVLLVSQGVPMSLEDIITNPSAGAAFQAMRDFILTAQRSNIAVYPIDPCGLDLDDGCSTESRQNLRSIAEGTGGFAVTNTNAPETGVDRMVAENGAYYLVGYYSPAPPNDGKRHRIQVRMRMPDVEVRAREGYVSPGRGSRPAPRVAPLDALIAAPIQTRGLTMRIVAIPAPLAASPSSAVVIGLELPTSHALRAGRIDFTVVAVDTAGKTRARLQFASSFAPAANVVSAWTRTATRLDVPPGKYQIRVAAITADQAQGSVFTEVTVPAFGGDLGVGGLSLGAPTPLDKAGADRLAGVLPLLPLAVSEIPPNAPIAAQLPIRVGARAASRPLAITATLIGPDGARRQLDRMSPPAAEYSGSSGKVYQLPLPRDLTPGAYQLVVETTSGRAQVTRAVAFQVLSPP